MSNITKEEKDKIIKELESLKISGDIECNHIHADNILCDLLIKLGHNDIVEVYQEINKWYA